MIACILDSPPRSRSGPMRARSVCLCQAESSSGSRGSSGSRDQITLRRPCGPPEAPVQAPPLRLLRNQPRSRCRTRSCLRSQQRSSHDAEKVKEFTRTERLSAGAPLADKPWGPRGPEGARGAWNVSDHFIRIRPPTNRPELGFRHSLKYAINSKRIAAFVACFSLH